MTFPPVEMPQRTERMVEAMLFYGYDALLVRSTPADRDQAWLDARLVDWRDAVAAFVTLEFSDLVVPYLTDRLAYDGWSHPMPSTDRDPFIRKWFAARRPGVSADSRVSYFFDGDFVQLEIGEGGHFTASRFIVPSQDVHPEVQMAMSAGRYPVRRPECWMSSSWWFANVMWHIASREGVYVDHDPSSFMHGHPRMAWYPRQYEQFGPP
jgi:hypothetical protein